jgi:Protein of unknown function (DUF2958)
MLTSKPKSSAERDKMKLLTKALADKLPAIYSQENNSDPVAQVRFFSIASQWEWFAVEFDGTDLFYGLVKGFETELGYFSLSELESVTAMNGMLPLIERDTSFKPTPLSQLR